MALRTRKPSYRIRKWSRTPKGWRDYITYLVDAKKYGTMGGDTDIPTDALLDGDYSPLLDGDGSYLLG